MGLDEHPTQIAELADGPVEYRFDRRGPDTVVVFHGGHMRAGLSLGEEVFADAGCSVLVPSRPGYGRTPVSTGGSAGGFADVTAALCSQLGIASVAAVVGVSAGGPTAVAMAARYPALVDRMILQSAVGPLPWPDRRTRMAARVAFTARTEPLLWAVVRTLMRHAPEVGLRMLLRDLTVLPSRKAVSGLGAEDRARLIALFSRMRSGHGFLRDLKALETTAELTRHAGQVSQPSLVIATCQDGAVPFAHARALVAALRQTELIESWAGGHFIWFGQDWPTIADRIRDFLLADLYLMPRGEL
ncbi:putative hydrolase YcgS [Streptomyces capitiformicae]|uniref:Hydrolase YcgS n=2 Tax=Streptomyces capitiformicae TaxID=2014920 RepID=A0A918ZK73_9ACTN|nr:putative hydrolase YcgS [Streptomyces capitiformicae]